MITVDCFPSALLSIDDITVVASLKLLNKNKNSAFLKEMHSN
jgi:hypothetical protein